MQSAPIDLARVRQLFSRPERLKPADFIQREIAQRMLERLQLVRLNPAQVLDAGCGSGTDLNLLHKNYPDAQMIGVDAAPAVLRAAQAAEIAAQAFIQRLFSALGARNSRARADLLCADFSALPLPAHSADLVWSNLALHWHPQPDLVFREWLRVLRVNGLLMFSCFGPDSLKEVRAAFLDAGQPSPTLPFVDMHDFGDMLVQAGFATPVMDMEVITLTYSSVAQLLAEVRALGGNPLHTRRRGLMGRNAWQQITAQLERLRGTDGRIPLTMEIIYGHAFRPEPRRTREGESIIKFDRPGKLS